MTKQISKIKLQLVDSYLLLAIYTSNSESQLAWLLNNKLNINLKRELISNNQDYSLFSDRNNLITNSYILISNNSFLKQLFPNYTQINYFFKVTHKQPLLINNLIKEIKEINLISECSLINKNKKLYTAFNQL